MTTSLPEGVRPECSILRHIHSFGLMLCALISPPCISSSLLWHGVLAMVRWVMRHSAMFTAQGSSRRMHILRRSLFQVDARGLYSGQDNSRSRPLCNPCKRVWMCLCLLAPPRGVVISRGHTLLCAGDSIRSRECWNNGWANMPADTQTEQIQVTWRLGRWATGSFAIRDREIMWLGRGNMCGWGRGTRRRKASHT